MGHNVQEEDRQSDWMLPVQQPYSQHSKPEELMVDFGKGKPSANEAVFISGMMKERGYIFKFLEEHIFDNLSWAQYIDATQRKIINSFVSSEIWGGVTYQRTVY